MIAMMTTMKNMKAISVAIIYDPFGKRWRTYLVPFLIEIASIFGADHKNNGDHTRFIPIWTK